MKYNLDYINLMDRFELSDIESIDDMIDDLLDECESHIECLEDEDEMIYDENDRFQVFLGFFHNTNDFTVKETIEIYSKYSGIDSKNILIEELF